MIRVNCDDLKLTKSIVNWMTEKQKDNYKSSST